MSNLLWLSHLSFQGRGGPKSLWGRLGVVSGWFLPWLVALQLHANFFHPKGMGQTEMPALSSGQGLGGIQWFLVI